MERCDRTSDIQIFIDLIPQFIYCFIRKRNNQDLLWINLLFLHQIFDLCRYRCRLPRSCTGYDQAIIFIRNHNLSLILIQTDRRIHPLQDMVEILFFSFHRGLNVNIVHLVHQFHNILIFRACISRPFR